MEKELIKKMYSRISENLTRVEKQKSGEIGDPELDSDYSQGRIDGQIHAYSSTKSYMEGMFAYLLK